MHDRQALCARNNAEFCDSICASHGLPGRFERSFWIQEKPGPAFYPNIITLTRDDVLEQTTAIAALRARHPEIAVKDSFKTLDLTVIGMRRLFDAEWIAIDPQPVQRMIEQPMRWAKVETGADLTQWQAAWRGNFPPLPSPVFLPALLNDPSLAILAAWHGDAIIAGYVLNRDSFGVIGLSNVFADDAGRDRTIAAAIDHAIAFAAKLAPGASLVGYESGDDLTRMCACGFRSAGPLRVWV
jgi:hypothetical protein